MEIVRTVTMNDTDENRSIEVVTDEPTGLIYLRISGPERIKSQQICLSDEDRRILIEALGGEIPYDGPIAPREPIADAFAEDRAANPGKYGEPDA